MSNLSSFGPKYRFQSKSLIASKLFFHKTNRNFRHQCLSLSERAFQIKKDQENKKLHNLSKQSFMTHKKRMLLSQRISSTRFNEHEHLLYFSHLKPLVQSDIFQISEQVMKNPFSFHRNMISKIKDDSEAKNLLKKWYNQNVQANLEKLKQIQAYEKKQLFSNKKANSSQKFKRKSLKSKTKFFNFNSFIEKDAQFNQNITKKFSNCSKDQNSNQLAKLIIRIQPFWSKVRLKI